MSIIRDNANGGKRIVRFANGLIPKTDNDGNLISGGSGRYAQTYADMGTATSGWFEIDGGISANDTIILEVSLPEESEGYFFGCYKTTGSGLWLRKSGNKIYYKCGGSGSAEASIDWEQDFHVYGFLASGNGMRLMYDYRLVNDVTYTSPLTSSDKYYVGRCYRRTSSLADSPANVLIKNVFALTDTIYHYYPTSATATGTATCGWYETHEFQRVIKSVGTASGVAAPYGVCISDLQEAMYSPYRDIFAILMADNGHPESGADVPDTLTVGSDAPHSFAFTVAPTEDELNPSRRTHEGLIPILVGAVLNPDTRLAQDKWIYAKGELIAGRRPYWHLWSDGLVNNHLFVDALGTLETGKQGYAYRYLLFYDQQQNDMIHLEQWEGYSDVSEHRPFLRTSKAEADVEMHNHVINVCGDAQLLPDYNSDLRVRRDDTSVFRAYNGIDIVVKMGLGNAPQWYRAREEVLDESPQNRNHVYGMAAVIRWDDGTKEFNLGWVKRMTTFTYRQQGQHTDTLDPFCNDYLDPDASQTAKDNLAIFRDGLDGEGGSTENYQITIGFPGMSQDDIEDFAEALEEDDVNVKVELAAITVAKDYDNPDDPQQWDNMILCRRIVGARPLTLTGIIDPSRPSSYTTTNYRFVLHSPSITVNGNTYYVYPVWNTWYENGMHQTRFTPSAAQNGGIAFYFCLYPYPVEIPQEEDFIEPIKTADIGDLSARVRLTGHPTRPGRTNDWYSVELTKKQPDAWTEDDLKAEVYPLDNHQDVAVDISNLAPTVFPDGANYLTYNSSTGNNNYHTYVFRLELPNTDWGVRHYTHGYREYDNIDTVYNISDDTTVELWLGE